MRLRAAIASVSLALLVYVAWKWDFPAQLQQQRHRFHYERVLPLTTDLNTRIAVWQSAPTDNYHDFIRQSQDTCAGYRTTVSFQKFRCAEGNDFLTI